MSRCLFRTIVGYLTPDSDPDLAPDPDQCGALPPLDTSICDVVLKFSMASNVIFSLENSSMSLRGPYKVVLRWLKFDRGGCNKLEN